MKQNISELAETIYRINQQSDPVLDMHFARIFKKAIVNDHKFYVPINRNNLQHIDPLSLIIQDKTYLTVFTDMLFVRIDSNIDVIPMKMGQIIAILKHNLNIYGISLNPFHKEYKIEVNRKNFSNILLFES